MICPACFDTDKMEVDMTHENATTHVFDPGTSHGAGEITSCVAICPKCGWSEECEQSHDKTDHHDEM